MYELHICYNALRCSHCTADLSGSEAQASMKEQVKNKTAIKNTTAVSIFFLVVGLILLAIFNTSDTPSVPTQTQEKISPDRLQNAARSMGEFMVKDDNKVGLRMWAKSLGRSAPDFASAESIFANIKQASNDFALYKDTKEMMELVQILSNQDLIFDEVILQTIREIQ